MPTAKVGEQSRLVKMKSTANMGIIFKMTKKGGSFFASAL